MGFCISPSLRARTQRVGLPAGGSTVELSKPRETVGVAVGVSPESAEPRLLSGQARALGGPASSFPTCRSLAAAFRVRRCTAGAAACVRIGEEQFTHLRAHNHGGGQRDRATVRGPYVTRDNPAPDPAARGTLRPRLGVSERTSGGLPANVVSEGRVRLGAVE